jgi:hypothetical protein
VILAPPLELSEKQKREQKQLLENSYKAGSSKGILKEVHMFDQTPDKSSFANITHEEQVFPIQSKVSSES